MSALISVAKAEECIDAAFSFVRVVLVGRMGRPIRKLAGAPLGDELRRQLNADALVKERARLLEELLPLVDQARQEAKFCLDQKALDQTKPRRKCVKYALPPQR